MTTPNTEPSKPEIKFSPELRDKIFEHLPLQARRSLMGVEVKFWPNNHGEMELCLMYDPTDNLLDIETREKIYGTDGKASGSLHRGCELHAATGEIHAYSENMQASGVTSPIDPSFREAEIDYTQFDRDKLDFFLKLFSSL